MPRTARASVGGMCYHVISRGNRRERVYYDDADYEAFLLHIGRACERLPMRVLSYCLMPNHFHLALWPHGDGDLGRWMQRLLTAHVHRHNSRHDMIGRVWQGRFKAFPVQNDEHLVTVLRYIERNPLRAGLVADASEWPWSSLRWWGSTCRPSFLFPSDPVTNTDWPLVVGEPQTERELQALRRCVNRGTPFGDELWAAKTAVELDLESTLHPRGRPKK